MTYQFRFSGRSSLVWLMCAGLLGLTACVQVPETADKRDSLVYPAPPDAPRFAYERTIHGSADVIPESEDSTLRLMLTGSSGITTERLGKPYAVAVHRGRIFVSDSASRTIRVFDIPEGRYFTIGEDSPGRLAKPLGIDVDGAGNLYVADVTLKYIMVYDRDGKFIGRMGGPELFDRLSSVTVDKLGSRAYAVDIGGFGSENHHVRVFDIPTGDHLFDIGKRGDGPGELNLPRDIAIGKDNTLYIVDSGNFRIQAFDAAGKHLQTFGQVGKQLGNFARPKEVSTDTAGNLYVIDAMFGNFQIFNPEGQLLMFIGDRANKDGPGKFMLPSGIFVDEDDRIYVVDQAFRKVEVFRPYKLGTKEGYFGKRIAVGDKKK